MAAFITLGIMGLVLGLGLAFAADFLKVEVDPRIEMVTTLLPGFNCGACGHAGCAAFAESIVDGSAEHLALCKPGSDKNYNPILAYLKDHPNEDGTPVKIAK